jgi:hypothetical protein
MVKPGQIKSGMQLLSSGMHSFGFTDFLRSKFPDAPTNDKEILEEYASQIGNKLDQVAELDQIVSLLLSNQMVAEYILQSNDLQFQYMMSHALERIFGSRDPNTFYFSQLILSASTLKLQGLVYGPSERMLISLRDLDAFLERNAMYIQVSHEPTFQLLRDFIKKESRCFC